MGVLGNRNIVKVFSDAKTDITPILCQYGVDVVSSFLFIVYCMYYVIEFNAYKRPMYDIDIERMIIGRLGGIEYRR